MDETSRETRIKQKRARSQLSCTACRLGKLRCNRATPCDRCIKRTRGSTCSYAPPPPKSNARYVRGRIQHLENLVVELMNSKPARDDFFQGQGIDNNGDTLESSSTHMESPHGNRPVHNRSETQPEYTAPNSEDGSCPSRLPMQNATDLVSLGQLRINGGETSYIGSTHWKSILNSISELKKDLDDTEEKPPEPEADVWQQDEPIDGVGSGKPALLRSPRRTTRAELLSMLPHRTEADRLVFQWFNTPNPYKYVVNCSQFQDEYENFWQNPHRAPTMWIGFLFAILSQSCSFRLRHWRDLASPNAQAALRQADEYHELAASAAVLADNMTPKAYTLECLTVYTGGFS